MAQLVARLVRNEKVGGSNPPSSTTGRHPIRMSVFFVCLGVVAVLVAVLLWRRWCSGRRECFVVPGCLVCPWAAARPRAVRAASCARRVVSKPGQAPPPPTGTAARPSGPSGALHTGGAWSLMCDSVRRLVVRPGPAAAHGHRSLALRTLRRPPHQWRSRNSRLSLLLAAPLVFQVPSGPAAREARASLRSAPRLEARPCPPGPPAPYTPAAPGR